MTLRKFMLGLTLSVTVAVPAIAQEDTAAIDLNQNNADVAINTQFGQWVVSCQAVTVNTNVCRLLQEQVLRDSNVLVARFIVQPVENGAAIMLAQVPGDVYLAGGAVYRLDGDEEGPQREMIWQRCMGGICEAAIVLEAEELAAMNSAGAILFGYRMEPTSDPIVTYVDLDAFGTGLDALR
jgi:invasion protein IalB